MDENSDDVFGKPLFHIPAAKPERFLRVSQVADMTSMSKSAVYRQMADNDFPSSFRILPGRSAWRESEIVEWMRDPMNWKAKTKPL